MKNLILSDPVVVSQAPVGVDKWGQWQFPDLSRMTDGGIAVTFSVGQDSAGGQAHRKAYSYDGGATWTETDEFPAPNGVALKSGDVIRPMVSPTLSADTLRLPAPDGHMLLDVVFYDFYKARRFPECFRGRWMERMRAGSGVWEKYWTDAEAPNELIAVTWDDLRHHPFGSPGKWVCQPRCDRLKRAPNGEIWMLTYSNTERDGFPYYSALFFVSEDEGETFAFRSRLTYDESFDPPASRRNPRWRRPEGFCEPDVAFLPDGQVIALMRTDTYSDSFLARSTDGGRTWSRPEPFDAFGVMPRLQYLPCGATLALYGRPGVRLRASFDPEARVWEEPEDILTGYDESCSNCSLLPVSDDAVLIAYSNFHYPNENGAPVKTILTREVRIAR